MNEPLDRTGPRASGPLASKVLDLLKEGILLLDSSARVLFANAAAGRLLDQDAGAMGGGFLVDLVPALRPTPAGHILEYCLINRIPRQFTVQLSEAPADRLTFSLEPRLEGQEGILVHVYRTRPRMRRPLSSPGSLRSRKGESRPFLHLPYLSLMRNMNTGFHLSEPILGPDGKVADLRLLDGNPFFMKYFGFKREDVIGRPHLELWPGVDPTWISIQGEVALTGQPAHFERMSKYSENAWEVFCFCPAYRVCATFSIEISARKAAERALQAINEKLATRAEVLEDTVRDLDAFSQAIAHDLRAPIRHINGFADLLEREAGAGLGDKGRHFLGTIRKAGGNMSELLEHLLALSRSGHTALKREWVELEPLVAGVVAAFAPETADREVAWEVGPLPSVHGDRTLLREVFTNLLSNALKFTRGQAQARIEVGVREAQGEFVLFVRDNGVGFDRNQKQRLFVVFQRLHASSQFPGSGVGLASVKRTIQLHGGRVWADAPETGGAIFFFALPKVPAAAALPD